MSRRLVLPVVLALAVGTLSACGGELTPSAGGRAGPGDPGTPPRDKPITRVTTSAPRSTADPTPTKPKDTGPAKKKNEKKKKPPKRGPQPHVPSDVDGRHFDLGVIVGTDTVKGVPVIVLDRWTARGVADSAIARNGYPLAPHSGDPFYNINTVSTYRIPVARGAKFTYQHCADISKPMRTRDSSLRAMTRLKPAEEVVLVTLDKKGRATAVKNDPAC